MLRPGPCRFWFLHLKPKGRERSERLLPGTKLILRTQNVNTFMESLLAQLADELLVQDITDPSVVLGSLSDDELQATYDHVLEQFALELLIGADKNSEWSNGNLVIAANHRQIHLLQTAFYAVRLEVQRRNDTVVGR
jgi:hypothetical protein